jgi:hypothetical protein
MLDLYSGKELSLRLNLPTSIIHVSPKIESYIQSVFVFLVAVAVYNLLCFLVNIFSKSVKRLVAWVLGQKDACLVAVFCTFGG